MSHEWHLLKLKKCLYCRAVLFLKQQVMWLINLTANHDAILTMNTTQVYHHSIIAVSHEYGILTVWGQQVSANAVFKKMIKDKFDTAPS